MSGARMVWTGALGTEMEKEGRQWDFRTGQEVVKYDKFDGLCDWEYGDAIQWDEACQRETLERSGWC